MDVLLANRNCNGPPAQLTLQAVGRRRSHGHASVAAALGVAPSSRERMAAQSRDHVARIVRSSLFPLSPYGQDAGTTQSISRA
ncbi:MAG: hypothetical protein V3T70_04815, partial [Phycisphaerae bacterium]